MRAVIRIGGSVIGFPPNPKLIQEYPKLLQDLRMKGHELAVVVGGGALARQFIQLAKDAGLPEPEQDEIAISVSRLFAQLLAMKIGGLDRMDIPTSIEAAAKILRKRGTVVMGGLKPGMTTDTVAALLASEVAAEIIVKATDQDGVYTKDPRKHHDAQKINELSFDELGRLLEQDRHKAGIHQIIDPEAVRILKTKHIKTIVLNGLNPENLAVAMKGEKIGTLIK